MQEQQIANAIAQHTSTGRRVVIVKSPNPVSVEFGGSTAPENKWDQLKGQLSHPFSTKYAATWRVAANPLTWTLRHARVSSWTEVHFGDTPEDRYAITHFEVNDTLDLRPHSHDRHDLLLDPRKDTYDAVTVVLGTLYHDFPLLGRRDDTRVTASWTERQPIP